MKTSANYTFESTVSPASNGILYPPSCLDYSLVNLRLAYIVDPVPARPVVQTVALPLEPLPDLDAVLLPLPVIGLPVVGLYQPPVRGGGQRFPGGRPDEVAL